MKKVLVVGQTPPPYGGQALMIKYMLSYSSPGIKYYHVRMAFSKEMNERGKFSLYKVIHLIMIIAKVICLKFKYGIDTLYYPPSNSPNISIYRDVIILFFTRPFFKKIIFHFHAAGISEVLPQFVQPMQRLIYFCLQKPDLTITSSPYNPKDGIYLKSKKDVIIPLGIPELASNELIKIYHDHLSILFVGLLNSTKGEGYLIEAIHMLQSEGVNVKLNIAGKFETEEYKNKFFQKISNLDLRDNVNYLGVITGDDKINAFHDSDIFCFPSFFASESFGIVLLEAMQFRLPIIATRWRGIQSLVEDSYNGFLVDVKNALQIKVSILKFYNNRQLLKIYGDNSRLLFDRYYRVDRYISKLNDEIIKV